MVVTVSNSDARSVKALALLATADRWVKGHLKNGHAFFVIPGSNGAVYWTDCRECTCPDFQKRGAEIRGFACKHVMSVRMWKLQQDGKAAQAKAQPKAPRAKRPSRYQQIFGADSE